MESITKKSLSLSMAQIAWVVKDITVTAKFFKDTMGIDFGKIETSRASEFEGTYYGKPSDAENLLAMVYSGGTFIELIQPVSGNSIFKDYLDKNPGGGLQHVSYRIPVSELEEVISGFAENGFPVITRFNTPWAEIVFFDTSEVIGVATEIMGITEEGDIAIQRMKDETKE